MKEELKKTEFFSKVYKVVSLIPVGRVTTYGAIANFLGSKKSARVVGWAMNASHLNHDIPAHRVVNRTGLLTGKNICSNLGNWCIYAAENKPTQYHKLPSLAPGATTLNPGAIIFNLTRWALTMKFSVAIQYSENP